MDACLLLGPLYHLPNSLRAASIKATLATGRDAPVGKLPAAFSHRPSELAAEFGAAGLVDVEVVGIEGPGWTLFRPDLPEDRVERLLDAAIRRRKAMRVASRRTTGLRRKRSSARAVPSLLLLAQGRRADLTADVPARVGARERLGVRLTPPDRAFHRAGLAGRSARFGPSCPYGAGGVRRGVRLAGHWRPWASA